MAEAGADLQGHRLVGRIGVSLGETRLWLQRVHGIASRRRTCASSEAFAAGVGSRDGLAGGRLAGAVRTLLRFQCNVLHAPHVGRASRLRRASTLHRRCSLMFGASVIKCCYAATGMYMRPWCMARELKTSPPSPERGSCHSVAVGHAETGHGIENPAGQLHLHALPYQRATRHGSADDRLVSIDRVFDHGAPAVA